MLRNQQSLINSILTLGSAELATEEAAIEAIASRRWPSLNPSCKRCGSPTMRDGAIYTCNALRCARTFTVFVDTPLASLRRPRVRALLLALRAMATSRRSVSALELARETGVPHATMWRHMHRLRELLPRASRERNGEKYACMRVCGRRVDLDAWVREQDHPTPASVTLFSQRTKPGVTGARFDDRGGRTGRLALENFRTWLNGTFHGVRERYLDSYQLEYSARMAVSARQIVYLTLEWLFFC